jgi:hypothetical protein
MNKRNVVESHMKPIEWKIAALATLVHPGPYARKQLRRRLPLAADRDQLIDMAVRHGLAGLFYRNFQKAGLLEALASHQRERLRQCYYSTVRFNLLLIQDFTAIRERLIRQGIEVVLLQGMDLLHRVYEDVGLRPLTDIDLWVPESGLPGLENILTGQGYRSDPLYPLTFRKGATVLDIHTHILWAERIRARALLLDQDQDLVRQRTEPAAFKTPQIRRLDPYDCLIYLSLHLLKHNVSRLIWLADIRNLVADWTAAEWHALFDRARLLGQQKCIAQTFFLLESLLDWQLPPDIQTRRVPLNPVEKKVLRLRRKRESLPEWSTLVLFSSGKGFLKGMTLMLETLFPRPDILRQVFAADPGYSAFRLYTRRFWQLTKMMAASMQ